MVNQGLNVGLPQDVGSPSFDVIATISGATQFYNNISGLTARIGNIISPGSFTDTNGRLRSTSLGSPGAFGVIFQAGSFATTAGSTAAIAFRQNFATANAYVFFAFPQSGVTLAVNGSVNVFTSGTANNGRNTSGVNVVGGASISYDYIAIGT